VKFASDPNIVRYVLPDYRAFPDGNAAHKLLRQAVGFGVRQVHFLFGRFHELYHEQSMENQKT